MKVLKDNQFNEMKAKADNFDLIVDSILQNSIDMNAEDVTAQSIIDALQADPVTEQPDESALQNQINQSTAENVRLKTELDMANSRVAELQQQLDETPAEMPAAITSKGEPGGEGVSMAQFADKNAGDTHAILNKMKEEGII